MTERVAVMNHVTARPRRLSTGGMTSLCGAGDWEAEITRVDPRVRGSLQLPPNAPMLARKTTRSLAAFLGLVVLSGSGCLKRIALRSAADALAATGSGYSSDDDPDLVAAAAPFGLKTMEQVLAEEPDHVGLLTSLASGFTAYAVVFVGQDADEMDEKDVERGKLLHLRARKLFLRARGYGLRGLELNHAGFTEAFKTGGPETAAARAKLLAAMTKDDVPLLYWTGAAWALAVGQGKDDMRLVGQLPAVEAMMARALALDESWDEGAIHDFYVSYLGGKSEAEGGGPKKAREHMERARALSQNKRLSSLVSFAEAVDVPLQDRKEFVRLLEQVLAFDVDSDPPHRLANIIAQRRARWLLDRQDELFVD